MKKVIALLLVMGLIFGVTYITQFTGNDPTPDDAKAVVAMPLLFTHADVKRDPNSDDPHERYFPGYFEKDLDNSVLFWFRNENPAEVHFGFRGFSCASCTNARAAVVPPEAFDDFVLRCAVPALPIGLTGVPVPLPAGAYAELFAKLTWTDFGVDKFDVVVKVPPAANGRPTWGVLRIGFKATQLGPKGPMAVFSAQIAGTKGVATEYPFVIHFSGVESFDVSPKAFDSGDLAEGAPPQSFNAYFWSVIRKPGELAPPVVKVANDDPFLTAGTPEAMTEAELEKLVGRFWSEKDLGAKILSAYRIPLTLRRDVPGKLPDIGQFEKEVFVSGAGDKVQKIQVKGRVTGLVWLQDSTKLDLKSYNAKLGTEVKASLASGRQDLELELLADETKPRFLQVAIGGAKVEPGSKTWPLTVTVPANQGYEPYWNGVIVLRTKGPNPQKVRIPVSGHGR